MPTKLSVNVNKVAALRNMRGYGVPSVVRAAATCIDAGVHGITVHPRPDERHIKPHDVGDLRDLLNDHPNVEYNIEGNPFEGPYMDLVARAEPDQATLVPDTPGQSTSDHGWDLEQNAQRLGPIVARLHDLGIRVSLFMDPDVAQIGRVPATGADRVELYTEAYAAAFRRGEPGAELPTYAGAAAEANRLGLGVNAGHDLNRDNLPAFLDGVKGVLEVSIGHELISDAIWMGLEQTVKAYLQATGNTEKRVQTG